MTLHPRRWLAASVFATFTHAPILAADAATASLLPPIPLDDIAAAQQGWVRHDFVLGSPDVDFSTYVPAKARVDTAPLPYDAPLATGNAAALRIVGKIQPPADSLPLETTITIFQVDTAPAAGRVCQWLLEEAGYQITAGADSTDLTSAQRLGHITDRDGRRERSALSACYVRDDRILTLAFVLDNRTSDSEAQRERRAAAANRFASGVLSNLTFTNGQPSAHAPDHLRAIPAVIGKYDLALVVPQAWDIRINDFQGALPAELHLTRGPDDESRGAVWLAAIPAPRAPSAKELTAMGKRLFPSYVMGQSADLRAYAPSTHAADPALAEHGIASQRFRFPVTNRQGERAGDLLAVLAWHDHTVYALSLWSYVQESTQRHEFFSRLPGLSAYDMLHAALTRHLSGG